MTKTCCILGCKSNYNSTLKAGGQLVSTFSFLKKEFSKSKWMKSIPQDNWAPTKYSVACALHFPATDAIRKEKFVLPSGIVSTLRRTRLVPHAGENELRKKFTKICIREMKTLQKAHHVNVIACRNVVADGQSVYLTMDYAPSDMRSLINRPISYKLKFEPEYIEKKGGDFVYHDNVPPIRRKNFWKYLLSWSGQWRPAPIGDDLEKWRRLKMSSGKGLPEICIREMETLLKAHHVNVIACRNVVVDRQNVYLTMDYAPSDMRFLINRTLIYNLKFEPEEVKYYTVQLPRGLSHIHSQSIIHRDLKPSNLLITHNGILKICDFGMARNVSSKEKLYSPLVVTRWYRAPEVLLSYGKYGQPIDLWSVGCIFAELALMRVLFPGTSDINQIYSIFEALGTPSEAVWSGYNELPVVRETNFVQFPSNKRSIFAALTTSGYDLVTRMLTYDPNRRITAEQALQHPFFGEENLPEKPSTDSDHRGRMNMPVKRKFEGEESYPDERIAKKRLGRRETKLRL